MRSNKENDMEEKTYTAGEAFRLMVETPGRGFTPLNTKIAEYRVSAKEDGCGFKVEWAGQCGHSQVTNYDIFPETFLWRWREYKPKPKRYPGVDVPRLMTETVGREFEAARHTTQVVYFDGAMFRIRSKITSRNDPFTFGSHDLLGEWIETPEPESEPEPKTTGLTFDEAREALMDTNCGDNSRMERLLSGRGMKTLSKADIQANNWRLVNKEI